MEKKETEPRLPTLQISCTEEFKRDVEQLAKAFDYKDTKTMLFELVDQFLKLPSNQAQLKKYRDLLGSKPALPFAIAEAEPKKAKSKVTRKKAAAAQVADESEGGGSDDETT